MCAFYVYTCVFSSMSLLLLLHVPAVVRLYWKMRMCSIFIGRESSKKVNITAMGPIDWRRAQIAGVLRHVYVISDVRWNRFSQQWAKSTPLSVWIGHNSASEICDYLQCESVEKSTSACAFRTLFDTRRRVECWMSNKEQRLHNHTRIYAMKSGIASSSPQYARPGCLASSH